MTYYEVMDMPLRAFWAFNGNVSRLSAEEDLRKLQVAGAAQSGEAYKELAEKLKTEQGQPTVIVDNRADEDVRGKLQAALSG